MGCLCKLVNNLTCPWVSEDGRQHTQQTITTNTVVPHPMLRPAIVPLDKPISEERGKINMFRNISVKRGEYHW